MYEAIQEALYILRELQLTGDMEEESAMTLSRVISILEGGKER